MALRRLFLNCANDACREVAPNASIELDQILLVEKNKFLCEARYHEGSGGHAVANYHPTNRDDVLRHKLKHAQTNEQGDGQGGTAPNRSSRDHLRLGYGCGHDALLFGQQSSS